MFSGERPTALGGRAKAGTLLLSAGLGGGMAGVLAALIDVAWSLGAIGQYLPSLSDKLGLLVHVALSYGLAGTLIGFLGALVVLLLRDSALPELVSSLLEQGTGLQRSSTNSLIIAGLPMLLVTASIAYPLAYQQLVARRHTGLLIMSAIAMTWVALSLGLVACLAVASALERLLGPWLSRLHPWLCGSAMSALVGGAGYAIWHAKLAGLPFKQIWVCALGLVSVVMVGPIASYLLSRRKARYPKSEARVLALAHVLVAVPLAGLALCASYGLASQGVGGPPALLIASTMGIATMGLCLAALGTVLMARTLLAPLASLQGRFLPKPLRAAHAAPRLALAILLIALALGPGLAWPTLRLLPYLRSYQVAVLAVTAFLITWPLGRVLGARLSRPSLVIQSLATTALIAMIFAAVVATGTSEAVRKAQVLHTGLGEPLANVYRLAGDWDRDGHSRWLGGGDCDDSDAYVHPNADEIPGDGIDNNCNAGDATKRSAAATGFAELPPGLPADFNVLLISIDTIRADHLGAYGYQRNTTPNIDKLASEGTLFQNGWAHAPSTRYSIPAILTGRLPLNIRYFDIPRQWPGIALENLTIAEVLRDRSLTTGAILNYWYFDAQRKMNQGFDHYDNQNKRLHTPIAGEGPAKTSGSSSKEQTDKALAFVADKAREPFFLWVHYYDPHYDYETHEGTPNFGAGKIDGYDHEIAFTDQHIGRLLDDLKARGLYDKTVIVLTGDHGEGFGEHGIDLHGYHLYAAQTKIPFVIRVPGTSPSIVTTPVSHIDILPTLANLVGYPSHADMQGRSLLGLIRGTEDRTQERYVFQQLSYENNNEYRAAVSSKCHIIYNVSPNLSWELYRIDTDPMEQHDIIDNPGPCADARGVLEAWYDDSQIPEGAIEALLETKPSIASPLDIDFGSAIRLLDIDVPPRVKRGESFDMVLTWQARARPPAGWKVFAHFEAEGGGRFTGDHKPVRPFSWWRSGQYIQYRHSVSIPAQTRPGSYTLWMGIYKGSERMPIHVPTRSEKLQVIDERIGMLKIEVLP